MPREVIPAVTAAGLPESSIPALFAAISETTAEIPFEKFNFVKFEALHTRIKNDIYLTGMYYALLLHIFIHFTIISITNYNKYVLIC